MLFRKYLLTSPSLTTGECVLPIDVGLRYVICFNLMVGEWTSIHFGLEFTHVTCFYRGDISV